MQQRVFVREKMLTFYEPAKDVRWLPLGECCKILDNQRKPISKNLRVSGQFPYYGANGVQDYINDYIFDGTYLLVGEDGSVITEDGHPVVNWATGKFWVNNHAHIVEELEGVKLRYLYHYLQTINITSLIHGNIPKLTGSDFKGLNIPVPPLEIQNNIVKVLDNFDAVCSDLKIGLPSEINARKKQYEFYRDALLTFVGTGEIVRDVKTNTPPSSVIKILQYVFGVVFVPIEKVCERICSGGTPASSKQEYYHNGQHPWLRTQEVDFKEITKTDMFITDEGLRNSSAQYIPANSVIVAMYGATVGKSAWTSIPLTTNQACCNLIVDNSIANYKYVYHWISSKYEYIKSLGRGSQTNINAQDVKNLVIPIPSLERQLDIVNTLDNFEKLCNDSTTGLLAEINARRIQYSYYMNNVLTFERKVA